jgi:hypothetical protein
MTELRIIVAEAHDSWSAWFDGSPHETFQGDTPGMAVDRLWEAELSHRKATRDHKTLGDSANRDRWRKGEG